jgi:hypothetical protein
MGTRLAIYRTNKTIGGIFFIHFIMCFFLICFSTFVLCGNQTYLPLKKNLPFNFLPSFLASYYFRAPVFTLLGATSPLT